MSRVPWSSTLASRDGDAAERPADRATDEITPAEEALGRIGLWLGAGGAVLVVAASVLSATLGV